MVVAFAEQVFEAGLNRGDLLQGPGQHIGVLEPDRVLDLPGVIDVEPHLFLHDLVLGGVVGLLDRRGFVADTVKTRRTVDVVHEARVQRPAVLPRASGLILGIELALDALLDAGNHRPLLVLGVVAVDAPMHSPTEVAVVDEIGGDDLSDIVVLVRDQHGRNDADRRSCTSGSTAISGTGMKGAWDGSNHRVMAEYHCLGLAGDCAHPGCAVPGCADPDGAAAPGCGHLAADSGSGGPALPGRRRRCVGRGRRPGRELRMRHGGDTHRGQ